MAMSTSLTVGSGRSGGPMTCAAAHAQSLSHCLVPSVPRPAAIGSPYTFQPLRRALPITSAAPFDITCTT